MKIKITKIIKLVFVFVVLSYSQSGMSNEPTIKTGLMFQDEGSVIFLKKVLKSMSIKFEETIKPEGKLIEWYSSDAVQDKEISDRVNQHYFIAKHCKNRKPPLPGDQALSELSCKQ